ncbi:MAG TPA: hypothetical protein VKY57_09025 [Chitinispirillaceae bacterium]|jgi:outer membrane protein assembly factor BamB|nr:hypothetical protein [Chitinispirillaceae bacterium]
MNNNMAIFFVLSIMLFSYTLFSHDSEQIIKLDGYKFDAVAVSKKGEPIFLGVNEYNKTGYYNGKSEIWKLSIDGQIVWRDSLKHKITSISVNENIISVNCFVGLKKGDKTYFFEKNTLVDSLYNKIYDKQINTSLIFYTDKYIIPEQCSETVFNSTIFKKKLGSEEIKIIDINALVYSIYATSQKLVIIAIPKNAKSKIYYYQLDLFSGENIYSPIEITDVRLYLDDVIKLVDSNTVVMGTKCFSIINNQLFVYEINEKSQTKVNLTKTPFRFYSHGRIYFYDESNIFYTVFDEQFDNLQNLISGCGHPVCLYKSFSFCHKKMLLSGSIKKRNSMLVITRKETENH